MLMYAEATFVRVIIILGVKKRRKEGRRGRSKKRFGNFKIFEMIFHGKS